jgi:hypothetical protein
MKKITDICLVVAFSSLTEINKIWNLVGIHFIVDKNIIEDINFYKLTSFLYRSGCYDLCLINIRNTSNFKLSKDYDPYTKLNLKFMTRKEYKFIKTNYYCGEIEFEEFLVNKYIAQILFNKEDVNKYKNVIFIFNDMTWFEIRAAFKTKNNIIVRGPSINKNHMLSPLQERLDLFARCIQQCINSTIRGIDKDILRISFHEYSNYFNHKFLNLNSDGQRKSSIESLNDSTTDISTKGQKFLPDFENHVYSNTVSKSLSELLNINTNSKEKNKDTIHKDTTNIESNENINTNDKIKEDNNSNLNNSNKNINKETNLNSTSNNINNKTLTPSWCGSFHSNKLNNSLLKVVNNSFNNSKREFHSISFTTYKFKPFISNFPNPHSSSVYISQNQSISFSNLNTKSSYIVIQKKFLSSIYNINEKKSKSDQNLINQFKFDNSNSVFNNFKLLKIIFNSYNKNIKSTRKFSTTKKISTALYQFNSPMYKILSNTLSKPINYETQLNLERFLKDQYVDSILEKKNLESDLESNKDIKFNKLNSSLIRELVKSKESLIELIKNYKKYQALFYKKTEIPENVKIILKTSDSWIVAIAFGRLLRIISNNGRYNKNTNSLDVYLDLAKELTNKYLYNLYLKDKKLKKMTESEKFRQWKNSNSNLIDKLQEDNVTLGSLVVGWLIDLNLLESTVVRFSKKEKHNILVVGSKLEQYLTKDFQPILHLPNKIPMIIPPNPYEKIIKNNTEIEILGGYLLNDEEYTDDLIKQKWDMSVQTKVLTNNVIYNMANNINSVAFKINIQVLDFIFNNYKKYDLLIDTNYIHPLALQTKLKLREKIKLESFNSKKDLEQNTLGLASIFRDIPKFYLPVRLDFRGRINCMAEYLSYQGTELAKSLLLFANGEKVYMTDTLSINYLKIFGANCFGNKLDKASFVDRINWVENNLENIKNFDNGILISQAESKLLFIAFCFEFNNYLESLKNNLSYFITHLPIQLDASCNGFQHLTLLIRDLTLSKELNLSESNWTDTPKDFYSFVLLKIKEFFINELQNNKYLTEEEKDIYKILVSLGDNRSLVKKIIMTIPYNATAYAIVNYIKENFKFIEKDHYVLISDPNIVFKEIHFQALRKALTKVLYRDYTGLQVLIDYLKELATISTELEIPIPWILPSGLIVQQKYALKKKVKVRPFIYSKDLLNLNTLDKKQINDKKQIRALMPNLIHSLDAASLALLIDMFFKEDKSNNFYSVHDCFAVTCNNVSNLTNILKAVYTNIYSKESYLKELDESYLFFIKTYYGTDCYNPIDRTITIEKNNDIKTLIYPDVNKVILNNTIDIKSSSYLIH